MLVFKILTMLWPFIKEMLFGQKTVAQILKEHKGLVVVVVITGLLLMTNMFLMKRIVAISHDYITLQKKYAQLESAQNHPVLVAKPTQVTAKPPAVETLPTMVKGPSVAKKPPKRKVVKKETKKEADERYKRLKKSFEELQKNEHYTPPEPEN